MVSSSIPQQNVSPAPAALPSEPAATRYRKVVVGADNSHWGRIALQWAAEHAWLIGAELEVLSPPGPDGNRLCTHADLDDVHRTFPALPVFAWPSTEAIDTLVTASQDAGLVVLGCQGADRHGIGLGTSVVPVAELAACDVVVVGGRRDGLHGKHRRIVVLLGTGDGTDLGTPVLRGASRFAALRRMELSIRRLVPPVGRGTATTVRLERAALDEAADVVLDLAPAVKVSTQLVWASPHEAVAAIADADVLAIGADGPLDSLARTALHHARSPVLVAHRDPWDDYRTGHRAVPRQQGGV